MASIRRPLDHTCPRTCDLRKTSSRRDRNSQPKRRAPTTPGEILREEFLRPLELSQRQVAEHIGCDVKVINRLVDGRTSVTAGMAVRVRGGFQTTGGCLVA